MIVCREVLAGIYRYARGIRESAFFIHTSGKIRRLYLLHFRKEYVERQLSMRRGRCRQCAECCSLVFTCPVLTSRKLCRIYSRGRLKVCRVFPIDDRDIRDVALSGGRCGYYFKEGGMQ